MNNNNVLIIGRKFCHSIPFFIEPINSIMLDMYYVNNLSETLNYWSITDIKSKIMIFNHNKKMFAVSIIHTREQIESLGIIIFTNCTLFYFTFMTDIYSR